MTWSKRERDEFARPITPEEWKRRQVYDPIPDWTSEQPPGSRRERLLRRVFWAVNFGVLVFFLSLAWWVAFS